MTRRWVCAGLSVIPALTVPVAAVAQPQPSEPYRFVSAPAGWQPTKPPTPARAVLPLDHSGQNQTGYVNTQEIGPQLSLYIPAGALEARGASRIIVTARPLAPTRPLPANGTVDSNVYRLDARADNGQPVAIRQPIFAQLRSPAVEPGGSITAEHRIAQGWRSVTTIRAQVGTIWQTSMRSFGDWALVRLKAQCIDGCHDHGGSSSAGLVTLIAASAAVALVVFGGLLRGGWIRRRT